MEAGFTKKVQEEISQHFKKTNDEYFREACQHADKTPLPALQKEIRTKLSRNGTDVDLNDSDPAGDGDQSPVHLAEARKQIYRDLFASGGDLIAVIDRWPFLPVQKFAFLCLTGSFAEVRKMLKEADRPGAPPKELTDLLETRDLALRLSPLLLMASLGKTIALNAGMLGLAMSEDEFHRRQTKVVEILLQYGARPDAKDALGKTVCHYGAGVMATRTSMAMVDMCLPAAQSSQFFGKEVELFGLKNAEMNGKRGIARGYVSASGRRAVYLVGSSEPLAIKPENLRFADGSATVKPPNLLDVQDRLGGTSLLEVFMAGKVEVAEYLLDKHNARIDVADWDGHSPKSMVMRKSGSLGSAVGPMIAKRAMQEGRLEKKAAEDRCTKCGKTSANVCSRCKSVQYCSRECQTVHWKEIHKKECKKMAESFNKAIQLDPPPKEAKYAGSYSFSTGQQSSGTYRRPKGVAVDETFVIKAQFASDQTPLLVYDRTRTCQFSIYPNQPGFREVAAAAKADVASDGRKVYINASFDANGNCTVYPGQVTVKVW